MKLLLHIKEQRDTTHKALLHTTKPFMPPQESITPHPAKSSHTNHERNNYAVSYLCTSLKFHPSHEPSYAASQSHYPEINTMPFPANSQASRISSHHSAT
ncbi:unnamed protein product [Lathyrus sativus]|nr:unnamed protein product [Lathyrus sativus]